MTKDNVNDFSAMLKLMDNEDIDKFYLSHLNYGGRGNKNRKDDAVFKMTRNIMDQLFEQCLKWEQAGIEREIVTGNNDADAVYFLHWVKKHHPNQVAHIKEKLEQWGGNASGVNVANIDNLGNVHPDTFRWNYNLGNVKNRKFSDIWTDTSGSVNARIKIIPTTIKRSL